MLVLKDIAIANKRVLIREDLNVPLKEGKITDDSRILRAIPTLRYALEHNAAVICLSHLGRPNEGDEDHNLSLAPIAESLSVHLNKPVRFEKNWLDGFKISPGEIVLCENVRFNRGEKENDPALAKKMAALCDVFVMDAFATSHRSEASTVGLINAAPIACAGPLVETEVNALRQALYSAKSPIVGIIGGAKVSTKLSVIENLAHKMDCLIVGGGIANTFLAAQGIEVGASLYEPDLIETAKKILALGADMPLPVDAVVAKSFSEEAHTCIKPIDAIEKDEMILDIGPETIHQFSKIIAEANTILWNGPVGAFELSPFSEGTRAIAEAVADAKAYSVAGGGDTIAAINQFNVEYAISYISTAGGAFLEFVEGKTLPALLALENRQKVNA